jgi:hypothetical protein
MSELFLDNRASASCFGRTGGDPSPSEVGPLYLRSRDPTARDSVTQELRGDCESRIEPYSLAPIAIQGLGES